MGCNSNSDDFLDWSRRRHTNAKFDESKITRAADGKFGSGGGSSKSTKKKWGSKPSSVQMPEKKSDIGKMDYKELMAIESDAEKTMYDLEEDGLEGSEEYKRIDKIRVLFMNLRSSKEGSGPYATSKGRANYRETVKKRKEYAKEMIDEHYGSKKSNSLDVFHEQEIQRGINRYGS